MTHSMVLKHAMFLFKSEAKFLFVLEFIGTSLILFQQHEGGVYILPPLPLIQSEVSYLLPYTLYVYRTHRVVSIWNHEAHNGTFRLEGRRVNLLLLRHYSMASIQLSLFLVTSLLTTNLD